MKSYCWESFKLAITKKVEVFFTVTQGVALFIARQFTTSCQLEVIYPSNVYAVRHSNLSGNSLEIENLIRSSCLLCLLFKECCWQFK